LAAELLTNSLGFVGEYTGELAANGSWFGGRIDQQNLGVYFMRAKWLALWHQPVVAFIGWTVFYFVILMILVYLYGYSGLNNSTFIYNEF